MTSDPSHFPPSDGTAPLGADPLGADPSMEEILASIRRILNEDDGPAATAAVAMPPAQDDVLVLDESMMVSGRVPAIEPPAPAAPVPAVLAGPAAPRPVLDTHALDRSVRDEPAPTEPSVTASAVERADPALPAAELVAPEAAAAAASSLGSLVRTLTTGRQMPVYSGGPTLEDMVRGELRTMLKDWFAANLPATIDTVVRAELRPALKNWLDTNLPSVVERLVRAEIERVVGRAVP